MFLDGFERRSGRLHCEDVSLEELARSVGTPTYVYSGGAILRRYQAYEQSLAGLPHAIHFAVKANSSLGVLALLAKAGAGFDIVSGGELFRVLKAGGDPAKVVFSGVGKSRAEIAYALESGIGGFNCESGAELDLLREEAQRLGRTPRAALRVNPDIDAKTHPYISTGLSEHKFGVAIDEAERLYENGAQLAPLRLDSISCHIGSQIFDTDAFIEAFDRVFGMIRRLRQRGLRIRRLDLGGGLGVAYRSGESAPAIGDYGRKLLARLEGAEMELALEPGRSIVGPAGVLLSRVLYHKRNGAKNFVIVDAAMNDLIRPALYQSHHEILPVESREGDSVVADVVGPVCESGDFLARERRLPDFESGELVVIATAGAYGFVQASNYNSRPRAAEVLAEGASWRVIRSRETYQDLIRGERA